MITTKTYANITMIGLRWMARTGSLLSVGLILLFFIEGEFHPTQIALKEWIGLIFFPLGVVTGLIVAWWKTGLGVGITLVSLLAFYGVYGFLFGNHLGGWAFMGFAAPSFLFLLYWLLSSWNKLEEATS